MKNNPYIGPRPFERSDRDRFFGRAREMRDLLSLIMAERVVLFYAQSGAGKTSLLNTQIVPALEEEGFKVLPIARVGSGAPRGVDAASIKNLFVFSALLTLAGPQGDSDLLHQQTLKSFLASIADDEHPPIVIFDQFEELLTTHRARWEDARGFFAQLRDALQAIPRLGVVLAMREDHVAGLDPYAALLPKRLKTRFRMELLGYDGALEAVRKPAQNTGCAYGTGVAERLVDDLRRIQVTANSTETSNGALGAYVEPVQLQVVCRRLWDNLPEREERIITWPEIEQFGDIDRALTDFYESVLQHTAQETPVPERQLRRWFATELITPMKTRGLALRGEHDTNGLSNEAVDVLDRQHLIRAEARAGAYWYELAHDRLVEPIVTSNAAYDQAHLTSLRITAQKWQQSKNADLLYSGSVLVDAIRFTRTHPDDIEDYEHEFLAASTQAQRVEARNRIIRLSVIAALSLGMIIMAALAVLAFQSKQEADQQRAIAYEAKATAEAGQQEAEQQTRRAQLAMARFWGAQGKNEATDKPLLGLALTLMGAKQAETVDPTSAELQALRTQAYDMLKSGRVQSLGSDITDFSPAPNQSMLVLAHKNARGEIRFASSLSQTVTLSEALNSVRFVGSDFFILEFEQGTEVRRVADGELVKMIALQADQGERFSDLSPNGQYYVVSTNSSDGRKLEVRTVKEGKLLIARLDPDNTLTVAFSPDAENKYIVLEDQATPPARYELFYANSGKPIHFSDDIRNIQFGDPGDLYFTVILERGIELRRMDDTGVERVLPISDVRFIKLSPGATQDTGCYFISFSDGSGELRRMKDDAVLSRGNISRVDFSQDPKAAFFIVAHSGGHAELRRSVDGSVVSFTKPLRYATFFPLPYADMFIVVYEDSTAAVWRGENDLVFSLTKPIKTIGCLPPPYSGYFVVDYKDGTAELRHGANTTITAERVGPITYASDVVVSLDPEKSFFAALSRDKEKAEIGILRGTPHRLMQYDYTPNDHHRIPFIFAWPQQQVWIYDGNGRGDALGLEVLSVFSEDADVPLLDKMIEIACTHMLTPDQFDPALLKSYLGDDSIPPLCPAWP